VKNLTPAERLIVAADFKPNPTKGENRNWARRRVLMLADELSGTGVCLKMNSILRACGYHLIKEVHDRGLRVLADLKLYDIGETLSTDGMLLKEFKPELLTVACIAGVPAMQALKTELPDTEVLGVTVLTNTKDGNEPSDAQAMFVCSTADAVLRFAKLAGYAGINGLISSAKEAEMLRAKFGVAMTINTPAIRPVWAVVSGDDHDPERIMTPTKAIMAGADRIIVGEPIVKAGKPRDAVMRTIDEIASAISALSAA